MNDYIIDAFTRVGNNTNLEVNNLNVDCITSTNNNFELDSSGNLTVNTINAQSINSSAILSAVYPVGSIYMSVNSTNPASIFGGTWEQIEDKFLLSAGTTYTAGSIGGEATHTLTKNEMPSHNHNIFQRIMVWDANQLRVSSNVNWTGSMQYYSYGDLNTESTGGGQAHNNMPPYLTVYMWKRIS